MKIGNSERHRRAGKRALALATALPFLATQALASGPGPLPYEPQPPTFGGYQAPAVASWSGFYAGVSLGYACCGRDRVQLAPAPPGVIGTMHEAGAIAGGHFGRDWQRGNFVAGVEASLSFGDIGDSLTSGTASSSVSINPVAEVRGRLGRVRGDGLLYVTGGLAAARVDYAAADTGVPSDIRSSFTTPGVSVGFGYEQMISQNWSLRGEYCYSLFQAKNLTDGVQTTRATPDFHALRIGLSHRF